MTEWHLIRALIERALRGRRGGERGYTTEFVIVTASLAATAIIVGAIIYAKTVGQATDFHTH